VFSSFPVELFPILPFELYKIFESEYMVNVIELIDFLQELFIYFFIGLFLVGDIWPNAPK